MDGQRASSAETSREFRSAVERLASARHTFTATDHRECRALCNSILTIAERKQRSQLERNRDFPILSVYISDGWSVPVTERVFRKQNGDTLIRQETYRHEFLLQRWILRTGLDAQHEELTMQMAPPISLTHGKKREIFCEQCVISCQCRGHKGIWDSA